MKNFKFQPQWPHKLPQTSETVEGKIGFKKNLFESTNGDENVVCSTGNRILGPEIMRGY